MWLIACLPPSLQRQQQHLLPSQQHLLGVFFWGPDWENGRGRSLRSCVIIGNTDQRQKKKTCCSAMTFSPSPSLFKQTERRRRKLTCILRHRQSVTSVVLSSTTHCDISEGYTPALFLRQQSLLLLMCHSQGILCLAIHFLSLSLQAPTSFPKFNLCKAILSHCVSQQ